MMESMLLRINESINPSLCKVIPKEDELIGKLSFVKEYTRRNAIFFNSMKITPYNS